MSGAIIVTGFEIFLKYSLHLPMDVTFIAEQDNILVFDGSSSIRSCAAKMPDGLPEHFSILPVIGI